jgi:hypothetical protein
MEKSRWEEMMEEWSEEEDNEDPTTDDANYHFAIICLSQAALFSEGSRQADFYLRAAMAFSFASISRRLGILGQRM